MVVEQFPRILFNYTYYQYSIRERSGSKSLHTTKDFRNIVSSSSSVIISAIRHLYESTLYVSLTHSWNELSVEEVYRANIIILLAFWKYFAQFYNHLKDFFSLSSTQRNICLNQTNVCSIHDKTTNLFNSNKCYLVQINICPNRTNLFVCLK